MSIKKHQLNMVEDITQNIPGEPSEIIQRNNKFYVIQKDTDESREIYLNRVNYLIRLLENSKDISYDEAQRRSYIWRNMNYYGMSYPSALTKKL